MQFHGKRVSPSLSWSAFPAHRSCAGSDLRPRPDLRSFPQLTLLMCQVTSVLGGAEGGSRRRLATVARLSEAFGGLPLVTAPDHGGSLPSSLCRPVQRDSRCNFISSRCSKARTSFQWKPRFRQWISAVSTDSATTSKNSARR